MRILFSIFLGLVTLASNATDFGTGADKSKLVSMGVLLANSDSYVDQTVTVNGKIDAVCKKKGCWMEFVTDDKQHKMRIKVKDDVMVFPVSAKGKQGYATGTLSKRELNMEQTKKYFAHIAEEQGNEFDASSITEPHTLIQLTPVGVTIED